MASNGKKFIDATKCVLLNMDETESYCKDDKDDKVDKRGCICKAGFVVHSENQKNGILVFGINPAGVEADANAEENGTYLYYLDDDGDKIDNRTYKKFYKPIFDLFNNAAESGAKWDWCNLKRDELIKQIKKDGDLKEHETRILQYYDNPKNKNKKYTLYLGEFFYYHKTSQSKFEELIDKNKLNDHMIKMLNMHIEEILSGDKNNKLKLIYINNATASTWLSDAIGNTDYETVRKYQYTDENNKEIEIPIIFGPMISCPVDKFSKKRLEQEIKFQLKK